MYKLPRVAAITALMVCIRFPAWSVTSIFASEHFVSNFHFFYAEFFQQHLCRKQYFNRGRLAKAVQEDQVFVISFLTNSMFQLVRFQKGNTFCNLSSSPIDTKRISVKYVCTFHSFIGIFSDQDMSATFFANPSPIQQFLVLGRSSFGEKVRSHQG